MRTTKEETQEELEEEARRLREKVQTKKATLAEAERLADVERTLRRMNCIRRGKLW
jgi:hypothetical protein